MLVICDPKSLDTGCWEWSGWRDDANYGHVDYQSKNFLVHRLVYEHFVGKVPGGVHLHHRCENPACANFGHLQPLTPIEHIALNKGKKRRSKRTHCPHGHAYEAGNLYLDANGWRHCKTCSRERNREYRKRDRAQDLVDSKS